MMTARLLLIALCAALAGCGVTADAVTHTAGDYAGYVDSFNAANAAVLTENLATPRLVGTEFGVTGMGLFALTRGRFAGAETATVANGTTQTLDVQVRDLTFATALPVWASAGDDVSERMIAPLVVWAGVATTRRETQTLVIQETAGGERSALAFDGSEVTIRPLAAVSWRPAARLPLVLRADAGWDLSVSSDAQTGGSGFLAREYTAARGSSTGDPDAAITAGMPGLHLRAGLTLDLPVF